MRIIMHAKVYGSSSRIIVQSTKDRVFFYEHAQPSQGPPLTRNIRTDHEQSYSQTTVCDVLLCAFLFSKNWKCCCTTTLTQSHTATPSRKLTLRAIVLRHVGSAFYKRSANNRRLMLEQNNIDLSIRFYLIVWLIYSVRRRGSSSPPFFFKHFADQQNLLARSRRLQTKVLSQQSKLTYWTWRMTGWPRAKVEIN